MNTKICVICKEDLPIDKFSTRITKGKIILQSSCKECHKEYRKKHYEDNKEKYIKKAYDYTYSIVDWFRQIKSNLKCKECGESRWWVLDFHHRDPLEKESTISSLARRGNKKKLKEEIEKCDVLCSNCHRDLHFKERQAG